MDRMYTKCHSQQHNYSTCQQEHRVAVLSLQISKVKKAQTKIMNYSSIILMHSSDIYVECLSTLTISVIRSLHSQREGFEANNFLSNNKSVWHVWFCR